MTEQEEKAIIDKLKHTKLGGKPILSPEEIEVAKKHGYDSSYYVDGNKGRAGHKFAGRFEIGTYITGKGFYKIVDIKYDYQVPDGRVYDKMLITYYDRDFTTDFYAEEIPINPRPLYNYASIGPKCKLEVGMILHIKEDTKVVNESYRIVWDIVKA